MGISDCERVNRRKRFAKGLAPLSEGPYIIHLGTWNQTNWPIKFKLKLSLANQKTGN
jgi:hypothetical protein